jgi:hypothetical protein
MKFKLEISDVCQDENLKSFFLEKENMIYSQAKSKIIEKSLMKT